MLILKDALVMANARRLIKKHRSMINWVLCMELFGLGSTSAIAKCKELGLDPDSNSTSYNSMCEYIRNKELERVEELRKHAATIPFDR